MKNKVLFQNLIFAVILTVLYLIYSAVLTPIYMDVCSDIILNEGVLPYLLEALMEICQFVIWIHLFSHVIRSVFAFRAKKEKLSVFFILSVILITAVRYFAVLIAAITLSGGSSSSALTDALFYFISDIAQLAIVFAFSAFLKIKNEPKYIRLTSATSAIILTLLRLIMRIRFDVFYGAPESEKEILLMLVYYSTDILYGVAFYLCIALTVKALIKEKNSP